jgi:hypothetical protein
LHAGCLQRDGINGLRGLPRTRSSQGITATRLEHAMPWRCGVSLRKHCSQSAAIGSREFCPSSPNCDHAWFYDFRVNRRRYRNTTETANKQLAKSIEARERSRVLENKHQIRRVPDITFRQFKPRAVHHVCPLSFFPVAHLLAIGGKGFCRILSAGGLQRER